MPVPTPPEVLADEAAIVRDVEVAPLPTSLARQTRAKLGSDADV